MTVNHPKNRKARSTTEVKRLIQEVFELYKNDKIRMETLINIFTE